MVMRFKFNNYSSRSIGTNVIDIITEYLRTSLTDESIHDDIPTIHIASCLLSI